METVEITIRTKELLNRQADYLRKRVRRYLGLAKGDSSYLESKVKRRVDQVWTPEDAVCITNLLSVYTIERRWPKEGKGRKVIGREKLRKVIRRG